MTKSIKSFNERIIPNGNLLVASGPRIFFFFPTRVGIGGSIFLFFYKSSLNVVTVNMYILYLSSCHLYLDDPVVNQTDLVPI